MADALIWCESLVKIYQVDDLEVTALQGLDLDVQSGEIVAIVGVSGSGKSTLMNVLGGLDTPSAGKCVVAGHDLNRMTAAQRIRYRQRVIGQLWQQSGRNLIPDVSIQANVELPQAVRGVGRAARRTRAQTLLERVGLGQRRHNLPSQLSGGEQQRAAIAVALANGPRLLLADEPTGELDSATSAEIMGLLRDLNREEQLTILVVTHDSAVAANADRTIALRDGRISTETVRRAQPDDAAANGRASAIIGLPVTTHRETIIIDRVGRLQLPDDFLLRLPFNGRAEIREAGDHLEIWPANGALGAQAPSYSGKAEHER